MFALLPNQSAEFVYFAALHEYLSWAETGLAKTIMERGKPIKLQGPIPQRVLQPPCGAWGGEGTKPQDKGGKCLGCFNFTAFLGVENECLCQKINMVILWSRMQYSHKCLSITKTWHAQGTSFIWGVLGGRFVKCSRSVRKQGGAKSKGKCFWCASFYSRLEY